jgi:hypothetical protein
MASPSREKGGRKSARKQKFIMRTERREKKENGIQKAVA